MEAGNIGRWQVRATDGRAYACRDAPIPDETARVEHGYVAIRTAYSRGNISSLAPCPMSGAIMDRLDTNNGILNHGHKIAVYFRIRIRGPSG